MGCVFETSLPAAMSKIASQPVVTLYFHNGQLFYDCAILQRLVVALFSSTHGFHRSSLSCRFFFNEVLSSVAVCDSKNKCYFPTFENDPNLLPCCFGIEENFRIRNLVPALFLLILERAQVPFPFLI